MASKDGLRDFIDKLETPAVRWALVFVGVVVLVRLRLILFAAALPVMAYWHYSNQPEETLEQQPDGEFNGEPAMHEKDSMDDDECIGNDFHRPNVNKDSKDDDGEEVDPYDQSFWAGDAPSRPAPRNNAGSAMKSFGDDDDDDDFGLGAREPNMDKPSPWNDGPSLGPLNDFKGLGDMSFGRDDDFGLGKVADFDFLGAGGGDDMDFLSSSFGNGFGRGGSGAGKGKGKGKKGDRGGFRDAEKGEKGPREANPKQVFVAGVGDLPEDEIRMFFEDVGEVDRLKVLTTPEGDSKGVCFVTFRTEDQAQNALGLHGSDLSGRTITVRLAHGGNKGEKGEGKGKGEGKRHFGGDRYGGDRFGGGGDRFGGDRGDRDRGEPSERFGGFGDDRGERSFGDRPKGKSKGGRGRNERNEMDELLEEALADAEGPVRVGDFDYAAKRFLSELRTRDRVDSTQRFQDALDMVLKYTSSKDRSSVRKWPAYIFTLLQKFDPRLWEELRERDAERRGNKGGGGFSRGGPRDDE